MSQFDVNQNWLKVRRGVGNLIRLHRYVERQDFSSSMGQLFVCFSKVPQVHSFLVDPFPVNV